MILNKRKRSRRCGPRNWARPVIAVLGLNDATEVSDILSTYGVLRQADVADVTLIAPAAAPIRLYPGRLSIEPQATTRAFDERHPDGADYVVVPAMEPSHNRHVIDWIISQHRNDTKIVSVCYGALTVGTAGLLDGRKATTHWYKVRQLQAEHPSMRWIQNRRYVVDNGVITSTGVTASIPTMMALVQAIGGREAAERTARELGVDSWDERHQSSSFQLTLEHKKTFLRNKLSFWRHETVALPVVDQVDEIALGLTVDGYSRTELATVMTVGLHGKTVRSKHGLQIRPDKPIETAAVDVTLPAPPSDEPAKALDQVLADIASRYGRRTAAFVALTLEYPWSSHPSARSQT